MTNQAVMTDQEVNAFFANVELTKALQEQYMEEDFQETELSSHDINCFLSTVELAKAHQTVAKHDRLKEISELY